MAQTTVKPINREPLQTRSQWRKEGRGIRSSQLPEDTCFSRGRTCNLYSRTQTKLFTPYKRAATYLVDLFGAYPDKIRYTTTAGDIKEIAKDNLFGPPSAYLERGFNYTSCKKGIRLWNDRAQSFHVFAKKYTQFVVIDLDNHHPTAASTTAHLELVRLIQDRMNDLVMAIGGKSTFVQYRGIEPGGIQIWVVLRRPQNTEYLRRNTQNFLLSLDQDRLDDRLKRAHLPSLSEIEILPTAGRTVSMPGSYGKKVFTSHELKITEKVFDCIRLFKHIKNEGVVGSFFDRYRELVLVQDMEEDQAPSHVSQSLSVPASVEDPKKFWTHLKTIAANGVEIPDDLHDSYLEPLAQCLLLREYFHLADKDQKTFLTLKSWLDRKHNGNVSRVSRNNWRSLDSQIWSTIHRIHEKTSPGIQSFYRNMRKNDERWPHRVESIEALMLQEQNYPEYIIRDCKGAVSGALSSKLKSEKHSISRKIPGISGLPRGIIEKIDNYAKEHLRNGKTTQRWLEFAKRVVAEIGDENIKTISKERMMILAGKEPSESTSFLKTWKNHLVGAGIIQKGWEKELIRGIRGSGYSLTPEARQQIKNNGVGEKRSVSRKTPAIAGLPASVITKIDHYAQQHFRKKTMIQRWTVFAKRVVAEIGDGDDQTISNERMMVLAGRKPSGSSSFLRSWKNHLAGAGITQEGSIRGAGFSLASDARQEINNKAPSGRSKSNSGGASLERRSNKKAAQMASVEDFLSYWE